jgi:DNA-binding SARP family transcriptional activator
MQEVFIRQPEDIQAFMRNTAPLRVMDVQGCNALRNTTDSAAMLSELRHREMFVYEAGNEGLRYHHVFRQFLLDQLDEGQLKVWNLRAARYYQEQADFDSAIYHLLQAQAYSEAANLLGDYGRTLLSTGRLDTLAVYLDALPPETIYQWVSLLSFLGDLARLHSRFQEALGWYQEAEVLWRERGNLEGVGRTLRGQARVYLDTVNPKRAEELLQQALRLSDGTADREAQARLYLLLAENKLNAGKVEEAKLLQQEAEDLQREGPEDSQLLVRVLLRTGRLADAKEKLEELVEKESLDPVRPPRAHRETQLLLSIINAMQGQSEEAFEAALEGIQRGNDLGSPFIIAVGYMRQGHAQLLLDDPNRFIKTRQSFEKAVQISHKIAVPRLRIEAYWGLCQTFGRQGDLVEAAKAAQEGLEIATQVGDEWIASLIRLAMGANHILAKDYPGAENWLALAIHGFQECSDPFGTTVSRLWLCLGWYQQNNFEKLSQTFPNLLLACRQRAYDFLFTRPTLLGPFDERSLVPLLILARKKGWQDSYAIKLLQGLGLSGITHHPGYQLRITTLGGFQVWKGDQLIPYHGWRRAKSRQLLQLFITYRNSPLDRDQICEHLWPDAEPKVVHRNFKVALNTLYNVLEPDRQPGSESAYILREGSVYGIHPHADIWLDADLFTEASFDLKDGLLKDSDQVERKIKRVLTLYGGDYLPGTRYETWSAMEREHLAVLFLQTADAACVYFLKRRSFDEAIRLCQRILTQDNCWEPAYRYMMMAYHELGDQGHMARAYQKCVETLREELDVPPAAETLSLYKQFTS